MSCPASLAPRNQAAAARTPSGQIAPASTAAARAHASASVATSIGCWSKAGLTSSAPLPANRSRRQVAVARFVVEQPGQQIQAALPQRRVVERDARGDHRLGKHRVRVGESRLGPRPRAIAGGCGDRSRIVGDELACRAVLGVDGEELGGAQCCEGHRPRRCRPCLGGALELDDRQPADHAHITVGSGGTEPPDAPAPVVVRGRLVGPTAVAVHSVAAGTAVVPAPRSGTAPQSRRDRSPGLRRRALGW